MRSPGFLIILLLIFGCNEEYTPKSKGYPRIDFPEKLYKEYKAPQGYSFETPLYSVISADSTNRHPDWLNIEFPDFAGKIYLSYIKLKGKPGVYIDESRDLVYKHTIKAESITETLINLPEKKVYGIFYDLKGNTASSVQFFLTDSTKNFLRGSLYFNTEPNQDSLSPVIQFIREDIDHLIGTLEWEPDNK